MVRNFKLNLNFEKNYICYWEKVDSFKGKKYFLIQFAGKVVNAQDDVSDKVQFYLYTQQTRDQPEQLFLEDSQSLGQSHWDANKPTVFSTHGFTKSYKGGACQDVLKGD